MSDAMSNIEIHEQHVELLPARTVLSMLHTDITGTGGDPGTNGADGAGMSKFNLLGMIGWGGSDTSIGQAGSIADSGAS